MTKQQIETIIQENMQKIYIYCVRKLENTAVAEDVASDIIVELLRSYGNIKNDEAVYGYMWGVANNLCKNYLRRSVREMHEEISEEFVGNIYFSPEESYIKEEERMLLRRELSLLREKYRRIIISYYMEGNSCEEIAEKYKLSVSNVKQCLFEGRKKLKEGMKQMREYGELSYAPEKFTMDFWGERSGGYWELFERKLPGNIIIAAYENPKTLEELSVALGVGVPYLEDEVEILEKMDLLVKRGKTYQSNMVVYDANWRKSVDEKSAELFRQKFSYVRNLIDEGVAYLAETDYCYENADLNARRWFIFMLLMWEASMQSEQWISTKITFPLLKNGSNGYVMGMCGEYQSNIKGIYSYYSIAKGYMRIFNFAKLSEKALHPFKQDNPGGSASVGRILEAAVKREKEPEEVAALSMLLEDGFVGVKDGTLCPEFATISETDYEWLKDKLQNGICTMAKLIAKHRDMVGEELRKKTPAAISGAKEVGVIVSMFSVVEKMVDVALADGYMTKGNGQNLTMFYVGEKKELPFVISK